MDRDERTARFREALADLISEYWDDIAPGSDDDLDELDLAEMGTTYPSCWVLVLGAASIENVNAPHMSIRYTPSGQVPFTGIGLLEDAVALWKAA